MQIRIGTPVIIGALLGLLFGRLPGLLIGAALGYGLSVILPLLVRRGLEQVRQRFLESAFAVMGALCKADGRVSEAEIQAAEAMFRRLGLSPELKRAAQAAFNRGKAPDFDIDAEVAAFAQACRGQPALLQMFLQVQLAGIAADGTLDASEHALLMRVARGLGLPESELERLEAMLRRGGRADAAADDREALADAYRVLGVDPSASDAEVKRAYRRLMNQNHPDKLASKGLPESMRKMAEEKTREIADAYERIRTARGR